MSKICGYSCKHNKSGVCQISVCDKKTIMSDKTEVQTLRLDELDYTIVPNSDIKPLLDKLQQENKKLNGTIQTYDILLKANVEENKRLKEQLLVAQTNEETFRLEMEDITQTLGLDEDTLFDDVKAYARCLKDNWNKLKEWVDKCYDYYTTEKDYIGGRLCFTDMKNKMQGLEQGVIK